MWSGAFIVSLAIVGGVIVLFFKAIGGLVGNHGGTSAQGSHVCTACGSRCIPATKTGGHFAIELILWLCFLIPGLIYSIWRLGSRQKACPACGSTALVPVNSPVGRRIIDPQTRPFR